MNLLRKLITGGDLNISRLHSEKGDQVPLTAAIASGPRAIFTWIRLHATGRPPKLPWFAYRAIARLECLLCSTDTVVEYGSGMSTVWFANRTAAVTSVESHCRWHEQVVKALGESKADNACCILATEKTEYIQAPDNKNQAKFDIVVIDGYWRLDCFNHIISSAAETPIIVIDDTDKDSGPNGGEMRRLEAAIERVARERGLIVERFTDFSPASLFAKETLIAYHPSRGCHRHFKGTSLSR
jgi:hypothetical protein